MRRNSRHAVCAATVVLVLVGAAAAAQTADELIDQVREKYESITDAQITFTRHTLFAGSHLEQTASGTLQLRKQNMYRVELEGQIIVTDGETVWSYSRPTNQVLIDRFKPGNGGFSPERILAGDTRDYVATLIGREKAEGRELAGLKLVPREDAAAIGAVRLWVDPQSGLIRKAALEDGNGKTTTYTVQDIRLNTGIPTARFTYDIPEGADVVDLR